MCIHIYIHIYIYIGRYIAAGGSGSNEAKVFDHRNGDSVVGKRSVYVYIYIYIYVYIYSCTN
jgi:hypothetical protein